MQVLVANNNEYFVDGAWRSERNADLNLENGVYKVVGDWDGFWIQTNTGHCVFKSIDEVTEQMHILEMMINSMDRHDPDRERYGYDWDMMKVVRDEFKMEMQ